MSDCSGNELPGAVLPLLEAMAENVHNLWAQKRLADGWKYGEKRDDEKKLHPGLVPYHSLPESEKEYDRSTAAGTIRFILSQGFEIRKKNHPDNAADRKKI